jgi:hypothetical protein
LLEFARLFQLGREASRSVFLPSVKARWLGQGCPLFADFSLPHSQINSFVAAFSN